MARPKRKARRLSKSKRRERKRQAARKAFLNRLALHRHYQSLPSQAQSFFALFSSALSPVHFPRFVILLLATILTVGSRTVSNILRTVGFLAPGDRSSYHRFFSCRRWSIRALGRRLACWLIATLVPEGVLLVAGDDTVAEHPGDKVYGKGCHRDAVRSSKTYTAFRWGHKWLTICLLVPIPGACRYWALPVLALLCQTKKDDKVNRLGCKRPHKTPTQLLRQGLLVLKRWVPDREFTCTADGAFASHELASYLGNKGKRLSFVSRFYADAKLYEPPPVVILKPNGKRPTAGRSRVKGAKMDTPEEVVAKTKKRTRLTVSWYGGESRRVETVAGRGHWYKAGQGLVEIHWVFVHDVTGTHRDEYFFTTKASLTAKEIVETYTRRWNIETTFQEMRSYVGLETTRGWKKETVLRVAPCLFGLYTVIVCLYLMTPTKYRQQGGITWAGKETVTYSDAITAVRRWLWVEWVFATAGQQATFQNLPEDFQHLLLRNLAPGA